MPGYLFKRLVYALTCRPRQCLVQFWLAFRGAGRHIWLAHARMFPTHMERERVAKKLCVVLFVALSNTVFVIIVESRLMTLTAALWLSLAPSLALFLWFWCLKFMLFFMKINNASMVFLILFFFFGKHWRVLRVTWNLCYKSVFEQFLECIFQHFPEILPCSL